MGDRVHALNINELESNPLGKDSGNEWVEIYSDIEMSLDGYFLQNGDGGIFNLSGDINGYLIISFQGLWLDNANETVFLKLNGQIIDEVPVFADSKNNDLTFSFCNNNWSIKDSTKGIDNSCTTTVEIPQEENEEELNNANLDDNLSIQNNVINNSINRTNFIEIKKSTKITLSNPSKLGSEEKTEVTSSYKIRIGIIYFFIGICVLLVILMALRKL